MFPVSWLERLDTELNTAIRERAQNSDPWRMQLQQLRGEIGIDRIERVTTACVFDVLKVPVGSRRTRAARRVGALMAELGWSPTRVYGMRRGSSLEQVRGYARLAKPSGSPAP